MMDALNVVSYVYKVTSNWFEAVEFLFVVKRIKLRIVCLYANICDSL